MLWKGTAGDESPETTLETGRGRDMLGQTV